MKMDIEYWSITNAGKEDDRYEMQALEEWCQMLYDINPDGMAVEIGTYCGFTAHLIARYFPVICIDLHATSDLNQNDNSINMDTIGLAETRIEFQKNINQRKLLDRIYPVCGTSKFLDILPSLNAMLIHIDGAHGDPFPYLDLCAAKRHLHSEGLISLHDFCRPCWGHPPVIDRPSGHGTKMRDIIDPWSGTKMGVERFLMENTDFYIYSHVDGICSLRRKEE